MAPRNVWIQFVDVTVSRLLDAVKTKYHVVRFAPSDVVVYANRAAFDEKQLPLTPDAAVGTCGSSQSDALIVVVPDQQRSVLGLGSVEALEETMESRLRKVIEKRKKMKRKPAYRLSDLDAEKGERILKKMRLECNYLYFKEPIDTSVSDYLTYLETHLKSITEEKELRVLDVVEDETLLSATYHEPLVGARVIIELKKKVEQSHTPQALGQLVSAKSVFTPCSLRYPSNAFQFIAAAVADSDSAKPFSIPFIDQTFTKFKIDDFLPISASHADDMMERYELMANALEPELLTTRQVEYMQHLLRKMPIHAHM